MKKVLKIVGLVLLVLIITVALIVAFALGNIIKKTVETMGPDVMGVPVTLENAKVNVFTGKARLTGLTVGNPEGYKTPSVFEVEKVTVELVMSSLFSDVIVIDRIYIEGPKITWEASLKGRSNLGAILDGMESKEPKEPKEPKKEQSAEAETTDSGGGKTVQINDIIIHGGKVRLSVSALGGKSATIPLQKIHIKDIGKESGGASATAVSAEVFGVLVKSVTQAIAGSGALIGKGANALADELLASPEIAKELTSMGLDVSAEGLRALGKQAENVGSSAIDVGEGASKVLKGIGGLLGGKKEKEKDE